MTPLNSVFRAHRTPPWRLAWLLSLALTAPSAWSLDYLEDALRRMDAKDFAGAIIQLKNAIKKEPRKLALQYQLGRALHQNGDVIGAEVAYTEALKLGISRSEVVVHLAQALNSQGRQTDMLVHPQLQPSGLPPDVLASLLLQRAAAQSDLGDFRSSLDTIAQARALNDRRADVWLAEVPVRVRQRQFDVALKVAEQALSINPQDPDAYNARATVRHVQGQLDQALADHVKALSIAPDHVESLVAAAGILVDRNQGEAASRRLEQIAKVAPREPRAAYLRAVLAEREGRADVARAAFQEVTRLLDPVPMPFVRHRPHLLMLNGLSHYGLGSHAKARQYLEAYNRAQPDTPVVRLIARLHLLEGHPKSAIPLLESHLRRQPTDAMALTLLGSAHMAQGNTARATRLFQEALAQQDQPESRVALGMSLMRNGRADDAIKEFELAWKKDNRQVGAGVTLAQLYSQQGRHEQALKVARDLVSRQPSQAGMHNLLGDILMRARKPADARLSYEKALSLSPQLVSARLQLARMDISAGALDAAEARLKTVMRDAPKSSDALAEMGRILERRGRADDAIRWLIRAREVSERNDLRWNMALIQWHQQRMQWKEALEEGKLALDKQSDNLTVLLMHARTQIAMQDTTQARATLSVATRVAEYNPDLQVEVAKAQLAAAHLQGAAYSLDKALNADPAHVQARGLMVQVELRQGQAEKAGQRAQALARDLPSRAVGHSLVGQVALSRGQVPAAVAAFRQAHKVEPSALTARQLMSALESAGQVAEALSVGQLQLRQTPRDDALSMGVGRVLAQLGRWQEAETVYRSVVTQNPRQVDALNSLANVQLRLNAPQALETAERAHKLAPTHPLVVDTLGWVLFKRGRVEQALGLLRDARLRAPSHPEIRYHLGAVLAATGRNAEARQELQEALRLGSSFEGADDARALLKSLK
jgi:cellulose synthase operon protein C